MRKESAAVITAVQLAIFSAALCGNGHAKHDVLFLNVIQVEGLKTPSRIYPKAEFELSSGPLELSQLTNVGKRAQYEVGNWLRLRYPGLIHFYSDENVYVLSSDFDSVIMSAETLLAGMYLPTGKEVWGPLQWQPVPVHTIPMDQDNLISMTAYCHKYMMELSSLQYVEELFNTDVAFSGLYSYLTETVGERIYSVDSVRQLYEYLTIQEKLNYSLPEWSTQVLPSMREAALVSLTLPTLTETMKILASGSLIAALFEHTQEKYLKLKTGYELDDDVVSLRVYSVHVETMAYLLNSLGIFNHAVPPPSSTLLWEMTKSSEDIFVVKIMYRNSSDAEPFTLTLPGCTEYCPMEKLEFLLSTYLGTIDCLNQPPSSDNTNYLTGTAMWIILAIISVTFISFICIRKPKIEYRLLKSSVQ